MDKNREDRIKNICDSINKIYSKRNDSSSSKVVTFLGSQERESIKRFSSGCIQLDEALGGGWPVGRLIEIYGSESSGKTSLCYHAVSEFQKAFPDDDIAWIDSEYAMDPDYAEKLDVDTDSIIFCQPESGDTALEVVRKLIQSGVKLIVIDSVAALTPKEELEGEITDSGGGIAVQARLMSRALRTLNGEAGRSGSTLIFTNQVRDKPGVMWGERSTTPGGRALKFYASIRVDLRIVGSDKDGEKVVSVRVKALVKKNKVAPPLRVTNFVITFGRGIDSVASIFDIAVENKIVSKKGAWYDYGNVRIGQGRANSLEFLRDNIDLFNEINEKVKSILEDKSNAGDIKRKPVKKEDNDFDEEKESEVEVEDV